MEYIIVKANGAWELETKIKNKIIEGFKPIGGVAHTKEEFGFFNTDPQETYTQSMVKGDK